MSDQVSLGVLVSSVPRDIDVITGDGEVAKEAVEARERAEQAARDAADRTGAAIARLRAKGRPQSDIAAALHITPQAVSKFERKGRDKATHQAA